MIRNAPALRTRTKAMQERRDLLRQAWLFGGCSTRELHTAASLATPVSVAAGRTLAREGQPVGELLVVLEGQVDLSVGGRVAGPLPAHGCLGAVPVVGQGPSPVTAVARTPLRVLVLGRTEFQDLVERAGPSVVRRLFEVLAAEARRAAGAAPSAADDGDLDRRPAPDPWASALAGALG